MAVCSWERTSSLTTGDTPADSGPPSSEMLALPPSLPPSLDPSVHPSVLSSVRPSLHPSICVCVCVCVTYAHVPVLSPPSFRPSLSVGWQ